MPLSVRPALDWGRLGPLSLRARTVADGIHAGLHRSRRAGAGVEFGGHRGYVPGDDLRLLDRRASLRHDRLLVRQLETETNRGLHLLVDATPSMAFASPGSPGPKLAFAAVVGAALARVALAGGDTVSLDWVGADRARPVASVGGRQGFERIVEALEGAAPGTGAGVEPASIDRAVARVARRARRGAIVVVLSDLVDLPASGPEALAPLGSQGRWLTIVRVLDPAEASFPFTGPVRLVATESRVSVETDADAVRRGYLDALEALATRYRTALARSGGRLVEAVTTDDPVDVVRRILVAIRGAPT